MFSTNFIKKIYKIKYIDYLEIIKSSLLLWRNEYEKRTKRIHTSNKIS